MYRDANLRHRHCSPDDVDYCDDFDLVAHHPGHDDYDLSGPSGSQLYQVVVIVDCSGDFVFIGCSGVSVVINCSSDAVAIGCPGDSVVHIDNHDQLRRGGP